MRLDSGGVYTGAVKPGKLYVKGTAFGGTYIPICNLDSSTQTGKILDSDPRFRITVSDKQGNRWVIAVELALALETKLTVVYKSSLQLECENVSNITFPYLLEIQKYEPTD